MNEGLHVNVGIDTFYLQRQFSPERENVGV